MPGWLRSAGSGPLTWMLSNATSTAWNVHHQRGQHQRKERQGEDDAAQTANVTKEKPNENQTDQRIRGRPGQGPALLYGGTGLCQEDRFQSGPISLADRGLARGAGRHSVAIGAEQQPGGQSVSGGDISTGPARGHVLHRRRQGRLRADQGPRRRVHDAAHRRDRLDHCHAEGHLRQPHSAHAAGTLLNAAVPHIGAAPPVLVRSRGCSQTPPRPHGSIHTTEKGDKEKKMPTREQYTPGPASGAQVRKDGEKWTLILVRELRHAPEKVWQALTDPAHIREWAPFEADGSLATVGAAVNLTWVGTGRPQVTTVTRADAPEALEYGDIRWELEAFGGGTRLTLWHNIDRRFISWGAAGWHICFDVLDRLLNGTPIGPIVGDEAMKFGGWQRLNAEYAKQFGIETPAWLPRAAQKS